MKRITWSLAAGLVILTTGSVALLISAGVVKRVHAQAPTMDMPPPSQDLPPGAGNNPAADSAPSPGGTATQAPAAPPEPNQLPGAGPAGAKPEAPNRAAVPNANPSPGPAKPAAPYSAPAGPGGAGPGKNVAAPGQSSPATPGLPGQNSYPPPPDAVGGTPVGAVAPPGGASAPGLDAIQDPGLKMVNPEGYVYDPSGRRDPFFPPKVLMGAPIESQPQPIGIQPVNPVQRLEGEAGLGNVDPLLSYYLRDFKLIGILWDVNDPKAMIRAPNMRVYTLRLKMKIGRENAVVAAIREKEIVLVEPDPNGNYKNGDTRSMKMRN